MGSMLKGLGLAGCHSQLPGCITLRVSGCSRERKDCCHCVIGECYQVPDFFSLTILKVFGLNANAGIIIYLSLQRRIASGKSPQKTSSCQNRAAVARRNHSKNTNYDGKGVKLCGSKCFRHITDSFCCEHFASSNYRNKCWCSSQTSGVLCQLFRH